VARARAAIIGLGQIGNLFDDDPKRTEVWTHAGAYLGVPEIELVAGADPDPGRLGRFTERRGTVHGYRDYRTMLRSEGVHLLSICSPTPLHYEMVMEGVRAGVKGIFCEKPLASSMQEAAEMVEACASAGVVLAVNHTRRWEAVYSRAKKMLDQGRIGRLESVAGRYPGKVFTMGTHLFDLMRYFGGDVDWVCGDETGRGADEPSLSGLLRFVSGAQGAAITGWDRANHLFELDLLGSEGRLRLWGDGSCLSNALFQDSLRFSGYRELGAMPLEDATEVRGENRLVAAVRDLLACVETNGTPACSGRDGMGALEIALALCESASRGGARIPLPLNRSRR
jgi:predicted dehydrogenase